MRRLSWLLCLTCLGCQSFGPASSRPEIALDANGTIVRSPAAEDSSLKQAAQALDAGNEDAACDHLRHYVETHPHAIPARVFHAEVLFKLARTIEARAAFEHAIAGLQEHANEPEPLLHCHGRLLDLAADEADEFAEHLHRGVGLFLLAQRRQAEFDPQGDVPVESILCKAISELTLAHEALPQSARPCWYLHLAWRHLGQTSAAQRWLHECRERASLSYLTPHERQGLELRVSASRDRIASPRP